MLSLRMEKGLEGRLVNLATKTGKTKSFFAQKALEEKISEYERRYVPEVERPVKDRRAVGEAISAMFDLRKGIKKPEGMSLKDLIEQGRM